MTKHLLQIFSLIKRVLCIANRSDCRQTLACFRFDAIGIRLESSILARFGLLFFFLPAIRLNGFCYYAIITSGKSILMAVFFFYSLLLQTILLNFYMFSWYVQTISLVTTIAIWHGNKMCLPVGKHFSKVIVTTGEMLIRLTKSNTIKYKSCSAERQYKATLQRQHTKQRCACVQD